MGVILVFVISILHASRRPLIIILRSVIVIELTWIIYLSWSTWRFYSLSKCARWWLWLVHVIRLLRIHSHHRWLSTLLESLIGIYWWLRHFTELLILLISMIISANPITWTIRMGITISLIIIISHFTHWYSTFAINPFTLYNVLVLLIHYCLYTADVAECYKAKPSRFPRSFVFKYNAIFHWPKVAKVLSEIFLVEIMWKATYKYLSVLAFFHVKLFFKGWYFSYWWC